MSAMTFPQRHIIDDARAFGRVAVLLGGRSAEREVSLNSGGFIHAALKRQGVDAHAVDAAGDVIELLRNGRFDRVFIALHGRFGEDGVIQGTLEAMGLPYTGSGVLGNALGMDKLRTKQLWTALGLPTLPYMVLREPADLQAAVHTLGLPMAVKPAEEGSSIGVFRVDDAAQLQTAWQQAAAFDCPVMAEPWMTGGEYTGAVLQGAALPLVRMEAAGAFYDYEAKYLSDATRYYCPCGLAAERERELGALMLRAFDAIGGSGWGRVDFVLDNEGQPWLLEANTVPGMTDHSLVPMAAKAIGMDYDALCWRILETSFD